MNFRHKLLILLLVIALVPLLINGWLHRTTMQRISQQLSTETRDALLKNAAEQLLVQVKNQTLLFERDRAFILQTLDNQKRDIENLLVRNSLPTTDELTASYLHAQQQREELFLWRATRLESGQTSTIPAGFLSSDEVPDWYKTARETKALSWQLISNDSRLQLIAAKPVHRKNGDFAGATALALKYRPLFNDWQLPDPWKEQGRLFIAMAELPVNDKATLQTLLEVTEQQNGQAPPVNVQQLFDAAEATLSFDEVVKKMVKNGSGVQTHVFDSADSLWVYAAATTEEPFPLLIIPRNQVTMPASRAADYVEDQFINGLKLTALLSLGVLLTVIVTAVLRARAVTKPLTELTRAAEQLSRGDFSAQVDIRSNDEFEGLGEMFNRIGPQLEERQKIKQSLSVARDIQQRILPLDAPQLENFEIAGKLVYCDETGGDYYDFIKMDSDRWGIAVGDVVGHGIGAALLMTSAAGILHSAIANGQDNPESLFASLNTFLEKDVADTRFMTLFFALLNPAERSLQWLSAGHGPMFLYRADKKSVEELSATTMPLGIMPDIDFKPVQRETFSNGDILAIGTDGIWEAINSSGEMFGAARFSQQLKNLSGKSAEEIISGLLLAVEDFCCEAPQEDDLTLIILKAT